MRTGWCYIGIHTARYDTRLDDRAESRRSGGVNWLLVEGGELHGAVR